MHIFGKRQEGRDYARALMLGALAAAWLAGVAAPAFAADDDDTSAEEGIADRIGKSVKNTMTNATKTLGLGKPIPPPEKESPSGCPTITVLPGTEAQRVMAPGGSGNQGLRVQYSLYNIGRECSIVGNRISIKVGADGRVLLGPQGAAGRFDVPIRIAIFSEVDQKVVESRLFRVAVSVGAGQSGAPFQFVSDNVPVAIAGGRTANDYSIKVGFDVGKGGDVVAKKSRRRKKAAESAETQ